MRKIKLNKDTVITTEVIKYILEQHKEESSRIKLLQEYYNNYNDIMHRSYNNGNKPKNKLSNPYPSYITNTATGYFLGKPITYKNIEEYELLSEAFMYNDEADNNTTLAKVSSIAGYSIEMLYSDEDAKARFTSIDPSQCAIVYDNTLQENIILAVRYFDEKVIGEDKVKTYIEVYDKEKITYYVKDEDKINYIDEVAHYFLDVPICVYMNNDEGFGDFEKVKTLIDAYDKSQSDSANDFEAFTHAYLVVSGYLVDEEDSKEIENKYILNFQDSTGKAEYLIKNIQDGALENYKNRLDNDIHRFSSVPNMSDSDFANNSSGVSLKYKLMALENITGIKESKFKKGLMRRIELLFNFLKIANNSDVTYLDIEPVFTRNKPVNDVEEADMMQKLTGILSEETVISISSKVDDVQAELERKKDEQNNCLSDNYSTLGTKEVPVNE